MVANALVLVCVTALRPGPRRDPVALQQRSGQAEERHADVVEAT